MNSVRGSHYNLTLSQVTLVGTTYLHRFCLLCDGWPILLYELVACVKCNDMMLPLVLFKTRNSLHVGTVPGIYSVVHQVIHNSSAKKNLQHTIYFRHCDPLQTQTVQLTSPIKDILLSFTIQYVLSCTIHFSCM